MRRLYNAICSLIEAKAQAHYEPVPYDSETMTDHERSGQYQRNELHGDIHDQSIDDDDGGAYRIGFNPTDT